VTVDKSDDDMDPVTNFEREIAENIEALGASEDLRSATLRWISLANAHRYTYNFRYYGRPIIQFPQDIVAIQDLIWAVRPDLIIETGIAHGGSLVLSAASLAMLDYCEVAVDGGTLVPSRSRRKVLGLDIDIRPHNRAAIEAHPLAHLITMIEGSSVDEAIVERVYEIAKGFERILVFLDSNHTHEHVLAELEAYAPLTSPGSYCVVFDTLIEDVAGDLFADRPWGVGNNPKTAVRAYLHELATAGRKAADGKELRLVADHDIENKLAITVAPEGYLRRV
jgi:cephalosporin hydroxylase